MENIITISVESVNQINFAMVQNYIPIFRSIAIKNNGDTELKNVRIKVTFQPEFAMEYESPPMDLQQGAEVEISPVKIAVNSEYLKNLTENISGEIKIQAFQGDVQITEISRNIAVLAYDQWSGLLTYPEIISSFVTSNQPKIAEVVARASEYLKKLCNDTEFSGYESRSGNVAKMQISAIYSALQAENIAFSETTESYEVTQKIQLPEVILQKKCGTSLDLAVLFCACLENVGLNPLLIFMDGRVLAGCWLEEGTFPDCLCYDVSAISKRSAKGVDIISVVDCTDFSADFATAESHGISQLSDAEKFICAVDIKRTRICGIRPLNQTGITAKNDEIQPISRQKLWERKLLDLSLRNSLLNFRTKSISVKILTSDLSRLEDELSKGEEFSLLPALENMGEEDYFADEISNPQLLTIADDELKKRHILTFLNKTDLEKNMTKLRRLAKVSLEENGANTIYLALGFLEWYETERSEKPRFAPLVLLPVAITRKVQDKTFTIKIREDGVQINITLLEMLRQNFGMDIKGLTQLPEDENGVDISSVFDTIRQSIMAESRWKIRNFAFIGQFSFSRFIMWNDICNRSEDLIKNKVVASLVSGEKTWNDSNIEISPTDLDENVMPWDLAVPLSADSSQLGAVFASNQGKSFVLHGPPGTGKSQTITNIIANAMYHDKTVLFVAEKMAALEVVQNRLEKLGLAPFCLELHSNKSRKRDVLNQLDNVLNIAKKSTSEQYASQAEKLADLRRQLNGTAKEIHKKRNNGLSLYDTIVKAENLAEYGGKLTFSDDFFNAVTPESYSKYIDELEKLAVAGKAFGDVDSTALKCCKTTEYSPILRQQISDKLNELKNSLADVNEDLEYLEKIGENLNYSRYIAVSRLAENAVAEGDIIPEILYGDGWERVSEAVKTLINGGKEQQSLKSEILSRFEESVFGYDSGNGLAQWNSAQDSWFIPKLMKSGKLVKELNSYGKSAETVTKETFADNCNKLNKCKSLTDSVNNIPTAITAIFSSHSGLILGENTDWNSVENAVLLSENLRKILNESDFNSAEKQQISQQLLAIYGTLQRKSDAKSITERIVNNRNNLEKILADLNDNYALILHKISAENWISETTKQADDIIHALPMIKEWTGIMAICRDLEQLKIGNTVEAYFKGDIESENLVKTFECDFSQGLAVKIISETPELSAFQGYLFEDTIRRFGEQSDLFRKLTVEELVAKLSAKIPDSETADSQLLTLKKAIKSGGRGLSVRWLFDSIPELLRKICPVMLMSPISVAQYIDPAYPKFDYVIFDEASQLPTCDAVGAVSRGENVIISGDPKQLPPTSFFSATHTDEENSENEDLESLLDDCLALSIPSEHLLWHYRSRHESLIAYSNA